VVGRVVHTAMDEHGRFECSSDLLNKIQHMVLWATKSNYHSIPTDCPHREKNGWTGDALLSVEQIIYNFDAAASLSKWMKDFQDAQRTSGQLPAIVPTGGWGFNWGNGPAWDSAYLIIPWTIYQYCGDERILEEHYEGMRRYFDFMTSMASDNIVSFGLGDWCPPIGGIEGAGTPVAVTSTGYYYADACILARVARLIGKPGDAKAYEKLAVKIKKSFLKKFCNPETGTITGDEQTSMSCALYHGLVDGALAEKVLAALIAEIELKNRHIYGGILGAKYVMHVLNNCGRNDLAYAMAAQTEFPGWGYWVKQGATTLWENWDGSSSRIHHMFSDIGAWFYQAPGGMMPDPDKPGFKHSIIKPCVVGGLVWVKAEHNTMYGMLKVSWENRGGRFSISVTVPHNTTATVYVPSKDGKVMESGRLVADAAGVEKLRVAGDSVVLEVQSGVYNLESAV